MRNTIHQLNLLLLTVVLDDHDMRLEFIYI